MKYMHKGKEINDERHIEYYREHIKALKDAVIIDGVELMGYTTWGCIDLLSASSCQMSKDMDLFDVDLDDKGHGTMNRYRKKSFYWYKKVIETNGEDLFRLVFYNFSSLTIYKTEMNFRYVPCITN